MSIILGLAYGINDAHCHLGRYTDKGGAGMATQPFTLRCGLAAGKIIDRNQSGVENSISKTMEIEENLQDIAATMSQDWWDITSLQANILSSNVAETRERLCTHIYWLVLRMHLYLPFLLKEQANIGYSYGNNRTQCIESARMLLERYYILRADVDEKPVYDSKTTDFIGFMAAIIMIIGISQSKTTKQLQTSKQAMENWRLLETSVTHFQDLNKRSPCKLFSQCHRTLRLLMGKADYGAESESQGGISSSKIFIPYFGTVTIRRALWEPSSTSSRPTLSHQSINTVPATTNSETFSNITRPNATYSSESFPASGLEDTQIQFDEPANSAMFNLYDDEELFGTFNETGDSFTWLNDCIPMMDIDQDWS
jgi:hypothetical protein